MASYTKSLAQAEIMTPEPIKVTQNVERALDNSYPIAKVDSIGNAIISAESKRQILTVVIEAAKKAKGLGDLGYVHRDLFIQELEKSLT